MKVRNEITVGALTLVGIVALFLGFNYLQGKTLFKKENAVLVGFENTGHVYITNPVAIKGFNVGKVSDIQINASGDNPVIMKLSLDKSLEVPKDSRFVIKTLDLFGTKEIELIPGKSKEFIEPGSSFIAKGEIEADMMSSVADQIDPIKDQLTGLMGGVDTLIGNLNDVLGSEKESLKSALKDASIAMSNVKDITVKVDKLLTNQEANISSMVEDAKKLTSTIADNSDEIDNAIKNFSKVSDELAKISLEETVESAKKILEDLNLIIVDINDGKGTAGKILKEEGLYTGIDSAISSLDALLTDLKENPKRYINISVFGGRNKE